MNVRERLLCLLFLLTMILIWGNIWYKRASDWNAARKSAANQLTLQQNWIDNSDLYSEGLARALERVDPSKTYSASQLSGKIDSLLRQAGIVSNADIDPVRTREGEIFNDHYIRVRLSPISIAQLIEINTLLKQETPYINIQSVRLTARRSNPEELDARIELNSFDLKDETLQN